MEYNINSQKNNQNGNYDQNQDYNENDVFEAFKYFDIYHNGKVNVDEIKEILKSFGENMSEEEVDKIFKSLNINGDDKGFMDYSDFLEDRKNNE